MAAVYCPGCGAQVSEQAKYCDQCGAEISQDGPETVPYSGDEGTCRLKKLLVIILGCVVWTMMVVYRLLFSADIIFIPDLIQDTLFYSAMILHHVLKKKVFPVILAAAGLVCVLASPFQVAYMYGIGFFTILEFSWPSLLLSFLMAVLLLLYTILGKKSKNNIAWMLVHLTLVTINTALYFRFNVFSLIMTVHTTLFYAVSYSPDFWYRRRR